MTDNPMLGHQDGETDESELELAAAEFAWETFAADADECRRAYVASLLAAAEYDMGILIQNMQSLEAWIRTGQVATVVKGPGRK